MQPIASHRCFAGRQLRYRHTSAALQCDMTFSIYLPDSATPSHPLPVIYWLSGLTCSDENFVQKAAAQRYAAEHNVVLVAADTSPRGEDVARGPEGAWALGLGAGFYLDATVEPWSRHYQMYRYIHQELPELIASAFPVNTRKAIMGHSMGGHGALTIGLKNPKAYSSISAFAPLCNPVDSPWGQAAFGLYLGADSSLWRDYDASVLIAQAQHHTPMMIDQGGDDEFLAAQLKPEVLLAAAERAGYPLSYHLRSGYDHSYFYIATYIGEHIAFHARHLNSD